MSNESRNRIPKEIVNKVRNEIWQIVKLDQSVYDVDDVIKNVQTDDSLLILFCLQYLDDNVKNDSRINEDKMVEKVTKNLLETLRWRHSSGLSRYSYSDFPSEYYSRAHITVGRNRMKDTVLMVLDHSRHEKVNNVLSQLLKDFLMFFTEKVTLDFIRQGYDVVIIFDYSKASYSNLDPSFLIDFTKTVTTHYPSVTKFSYAFALPWYTNAVVKMLMKILPTRVTSKFKVLDKEDIFKELPIELIPEYMGGQNVMENVFPSLTPEVTLADLKEKLAISEQDVSKQIRIYKET